MIHAKSFKTSLLRTLALVLTLLWSGTIANAAGARNGPNAAAAGTPGPSNPAGNPAGGTSVPDRGPKDNPDIPTPPGGDEPGEQTGDAPPGGPRPGGDGSGVGELPPAVVSVVGERLRRMLE